MRKTLVMLLIAAVPLIAFSQSKLHYSYDNAGNRVKREIVVKTSHYRIVPIRSIILSCCPIRTSVSIPILPKGI